MKYRFLLLFLVSALVISLWGCGSTPATGWVTTKDGQCYADESGSYLTGWQEIDGRRYYFREDAGNAMAVGWLSLPQGIYYLAEDGSAVSGWTTVNETLYCFDETGKMVTGWADRDGQRCYLGSDGRLQSGWIRDGGLDYYLNEAGCPVTGWQQLGAHRYYFQENGSMLTGWAQFDENRYYFASNGPMQTGRVEIDGDVYIFDDAGIMQTGWASFGEYRYYLQEGGAAVTGPAAIDGDTCYFTPKGIYVPLVNPWNTLPDDYETELSYIDQRQQVSSSCYDALMQMLSDCAAAGFDTRVVSGYRTTADQEYLFYRKINYFLDLDYDWNHAREEAAKVVAVPGTSEHQLGLAVDIVDASFPYLEDTQADTAAQKWLMEHCYEYGFILRYPAGTTPITGIIYEPWHYRYVGKEVSQEIGKLGITLEEYLHATQGQ